MLTSSHPWGNDSEGPTHHKTKHGTVGYKLKFGNRCYPLPPLGKSFLRVPPITKINFGSVGNKLKSALLQRGIIVPTYRVGPHPRVSPLHLLWKGNRCLPILMVN